MIREPAQKFSLMIKEPNGIHTSIVGGIGVTKKVTSLHYRQDHVS